MSKLKVPSGSAWRRPAVALALLALTGCSSGRTGAGPSPSASPALPTPTVTPTSTPSPPPAIFSVTGLLETISDLAELGPRHSTSAAYGRAADLVAGRLEAIGYRVSRQTFPLPAGVNDGQRVPAGSSRNVIATSPGYRADLPHVVVGAHLDTTPDSPGANDNASGVAMMIELARLTALEPPPMQLVFVAFGGEERIKHGGSSSFTAGSTAYLRRLDASEARALKGFVNLDMVGVGTRPFIMGGTNVLTTRAIAAAKRLGTPYYRRTTTGPSDDLPFQRAGVPTVWFYSGDVPDEWFHAPGDVPDLIQPHEVRLIGRVVWEMLRGLRL